VSGLLIVLGAFFVAMVGSELALRGTKLQTGLSAVVVVWGLIYLLALYPTQRYGGTGPLALTVFWAGAFLSWFGVRSHIESSVLLRMLYLLRGQSRAEASLLAAYEALYGEEKRREELARGGMTTKMGDRVVVTPKGRAILRAVSTLR
jgi:hypothetical protein